MEQLFALRDAYFLAFLIPFYIAIMMSAPRAFAWVIVPFIAAVVYNLSHPGLIGSEQFRAIAFGWVLTGLLAYIFTNTILYAYRLAAKKVSISESLSVWKSEWPSLALFALLTIGYTWVFYSYNPYKDSAADYFDSRQNGVPVTGIIKVGNVVSSDDGAYTSYASKKLLMNYYKMELSRAHIGYKFSECAIERNIESPDFYVMASSFATQVEWFKGRYEEKAKDKKIQGYHYSGDEGFRQARQSLHGNRLSLNTLVSSLTNARREVVSPLIGFDFTDYIPGFSADRRAFNKCAIQLKSSIEKLEKYTDWFSQKYGIELKQKSYPTYGKMLASANSK